MATALIAGQTVEVGDPAAQWKFASAYRAAHATGLMIRWHRTEKSAAKGQWDSAEMRKAWTLVGHGPIVH